MSRYKYIHTTSTFVNKIREIVSFELGKEIEKNVFSSCHERGTKILSSHELLMGTQNFFLCPTLVTRRKTSFSTFTLLLLIKNIEYVFCPVSSCGRFQVYVDRKYSEKKEKI